MKKSKSSLLLADEQAKERTESQASKRFWADWKTSMRVGVIAVCLFLVAGAFGAGMKYLEESAKRQKATSKNSASERDAGLLNNLNPFVEPPLPTSTPQLSKEYIYAGGRMLAVEDANASAAPPADLAIWRPSTGVWWVMGGQGSQQTNVAWGASTDKTVPGDYDGDGKTDFSVWRPSTGYWYVIHSSTGYSTELPFGLSDDQRAQADYDGDGRTDPAVFRNQSPNGWWYIARSGGTGILSEQFGLGTDKPAPADYDGDGKADLAVWRGNNQRFYVKRSSNGAMMTEQLGQTEGDIPVSADYDGDGKADFAVRSGNVWYIKQSSSGTAPALEISWQLSTDKEVHNDYDGDGKVDIAVWREAIGWWFIRQSSKEGQPASMQLREAQWGQTGDIPVPAFYRR